MTKIENKTQYDWAVNRVEELLPLVDDNTLAVGYFAVAEAANIFIFEE